MVWEFTILQYMADENQRHFNDDAGANTGKNKSIPHALSKVQTRFQLMWAGQTWWAGEWDMCDGQVLANSFYDNEGRLVVNVPMEENLLEVITGRNSNSLQFKVEPNGKDVSVQDTQPAYYSLLYYLNRREENFHQKYKKRIYDWAKYGTGVFDKRIKWKNFINYNLKAGIEISPDDIWDENYYEEVENTQYSFCPEPVSLRWFYMDEKAMYQSDFNQAEDCIRIRTMSPDQVRQTYGKNPLFDIPDSLTGYVPPSPQYGQYGFNDVRKTLIIEYFNKITREYIMVLNFTDVAYNGKMLRGGEGLPFEVAQYWTNTGCLYGLGVCRKVRYLKIYKSEMLQYLLDGTSIQSGINVVLWDGAGLNGNMQTWASNINIWEMTGDIKQMQQMQLNANLSALTNVLAVLDDLVMQDTWENVKAAYDLPNLSETLGEIDEQNKAIRTRTVDENKNIALSNCLTDMLELIKDYAPAVMSKQLKYNGDVVKVEFPTIQMKDVVIKEKKVNGKVVKEYVEDYGKYGTFELSPGTIKGQTGSMLVHITTSSTDNASMNVVQQKKYDTFLGKFIELITVMPDPEKAKLLEQYPAQELLEYMKLSYGFTDKNVAQTKKDEIDMKNKKLTQEILQSLWYDVGQNENAPQDNGAVIEQMKQAAATRPVNGFTPPGWAPQWATPPEQQQVPANAIPAWAGGR